MENFLVALAFVAQIADGATTCHRLAHGGYERNPLLPNSCGGILTVKAASLAVIPITPKKWRGAAVAFNVSSGTAGVILTFAWR